MVRGRAGAGRLSFQDPSFFRKYIERIYFSRITPEPPPQIERKRKWRISFGETFSLRS